MIRALIVAAATSHAVLPTVVIRLWSQRGVYMMSIAPAMVFSRCVDAAQQLSPRTTAGVTAGAGAATATTTAAAAAGRGRRGWQ